MDIMLMRKLSLYSGKEISNEIAREYSLFKLGDKDAMVNLTNKMADFVQTEVQSLRKSNHAIYATNKHPLNKFCTKNSFLLAKRIASKLKLNLLVGEYKYTYDAKSFYDDCLQRKSIIHPPIIENKKELKKEGNSIVMIDDSIVSGTSLAVSLKELAHITDSVTFFSILKLDESKHSEGYFNNYIVEKESSHIIKNIIREKNYVFTSHMLRTISELKFDERRDLLKSISERKIELFKKATKVYFGGEISKKLFQSCPGQ